MLHGRRQPPKKDVIGEKKCSWVGVLSSNKLIRWQWWCHLEYSMKLRATNEFTWLTCDAYTCRFGAYDLSIWIGWCIAVTHKVSRLCIVVHFLTADLDGRPIEREMRAWIGTLLNSMSRIVQLKIQILQSSHSTLYYVFFWMKPPVTHHKNAPVDNPLRRNSGWWPKKSAWLSD